MDAGAYKAPVAGVAMGMIKEEEEVAILTDIQGVEDALGDMDFKVAGTQKGITALQMDIKTTGIDRETLSAALEQAKKGRLYILEKMREAIAEPRPELSRLRQELSRLMLIPIKSGILSVPAENYQKNY